MAPLVGSRRRQAFDFTPNSAPSRPAEGFRFFGQLCQVLRPTRREITRACVPVLMANSFDPKLYARARVCFFGARRHPHARAAGTSTGPGQTGGGVGRGPVRRAACWGTGGM